MAPGRNWNYLDAEFVDGIKLPNNSCRPAQKEPPMRQGLPHFLGVKLQLCGHCQESQRKAQQAHVGIPLLRAGARGYCGYCARPVRPIHLSPSPLAEGPEGTSRISRTQEPRQYRGRWALSAGPALRRGVEERMSCPPKMQTCLDPS